jgi:G3E family GTPase
VIKKKEDK